MVIRQFIAWYLFAALAVAVTDLVPCADAAAQGNEIAAAVASAPAKASATNRPPSLRVYLENLHYDVAARGALLVVAPDKPLPADAGQTDSVGHLSLGGLARRAGREVVTIGSLTVLAPETMKVIESNPGKANPLRDLPSDEAFELLMGTFTREQWQTVCGANGIGFGDLNDDQKLLFNAILSKIEIRKYRVVMDPKWRWINYTEREIIPMNDGTSVRMRLNRSEHYRMSAPGTTNPFAAIFGGPTGDDDEPGDVIVRVYSKDGSGPGDPSYGHRTSAFGVPLVRVAPNRQKASQLDYSSARLNAPVFLNDLNDKSTLGDLIARVVQATKLDIVPDRRVRDMTVYIRGDSVRAGDLLQALALAVTGTYRKIGATSTYVLTSDIDGVGARLTRLEAWAEQAQEERRRIVDAAVKRAARMHPLDFLTFAPDDPLALSPDQTRQIDDRNRNLSRKDALFYMDKTAASDLPADFQAAIQKRADRGQERLGVPVDTSKIILMSSLFATFSIPGVGRIAPDGSSGLSAFGFLLRDLAYDAVDHAPAAPATKPVAPDWSSLNAPNERRVLLVAPTTDADAKRLVAEASRHGFTDVWLRVDPAKDDESAAQRALLTAAVAAGVEHKIAVGADISLLQNGGPDGEPERNIYGQTGDEFAVPYTEPGGSTPRYDGIVQAMVPEPDLKDHYTNWRSIDENTLARRVIDLADIPGLAGLVFQATASPGFVRTEEYDVGPLIGGEFGFTDTRRAAFVHETGVDPIDVSRTGFRLFQLRGIDLTLPFFPDAVLVRNRNANGSPGKGTTYRVPEALWDDFREAENKQLMRNLYQRVRTIRPTLPLWIDDRVSDYVAVTEAWFGTWDDPNKLPYHGSRSSLKADHAAARAASKTALLSGTVPAGTTADGDTAAVTLFISTLGTRAVSEGWNGVVFDFSRITPDAGLRLLQKIPVLGSAHGLATAQQRRTLRAGASP